MTYICIPNGALAEWLGAGLQNLSQWFDSATHLIKVPQRKFGALSLFVLLFIIFAI